MTKPAFHLNYDQGKLADKLKTDSKPTVHSLIEKYLEENPTGEPLKNDNVQARWEDLENLYMSIISELAKIGQRVQAAGDNINQTRNPEYIERGSKLLTMFAKDLERFYLDLSNIKTHHCNGDVFMSGFVSEENIIKYLELGEEYKELGLRSIQLLQPVALGLTELMISVKEEIVKREAEKEKELKGESVEFKETTTTTEEKTSSVSEQA